MGGSPNVIGVEILVPSIVAAQEYLSVILGGDLVFRGSVTEPPGERAVIDMGTITITLFEPADTGEGILTDRRPRVTQLMLGADADTIDETARRSHEVGVPTRSLPDDRRFVAPKVMEGIIGFDLAVTLSVLDDLA